MKAWSIITGVIGIVGAAVGIAWWLGVTPEMVGAQIYSVSYVALPFVMVLSGILIGWNAKKCQIVISRRKLRSDILALPGESKAMLEWLHREGDVSTVDKQSNARMMHLMGWGMVGMIEKTISLDDSIGDTWMVVPRVSNIIDKDIKVSEDLDKAYEYWYEDTE